MKSKIEFPQLDVLRFDTKYDRVKTGHFYKYHMDYDHDTNNCKELEVFVEDHIHKGKPQEFLGEAQV